MKGTGSLLSLGNVGRAGGQAAFSGPDPGSLLPGAALQVAGINRGHTAGGARGTAMERVEFSGSLGKRDVQKRELGARTASLSR